VRTPPLVGDGASGISKGDDIAGSQDSLRTSLVQAPEPPEGFDPSKFSIISRHFFGLGLLIVERYHDPVQEPEVRAA
jgi:hypothetical protein